MSPGTIGRAIDRGPARIEKWLACRWIGQTPSRLSLVYDDDPPGRLE